ncbi:MAG: hypothetical protein IJY28_04655 [Clostridia bacterium]|nr:hypothetical protein [Clostridia bacterium]
MKKALSAWTPVVVEDRADGFTLRVWGRSYTFDNAILPTSITSRDGELLDRPVKLVPVFGDRTEEWTEITHALVSADEEKAVVSVSATAGNVVFSGTVTAEYDGFVRMDLQLCNFWQFSDDDLAVPKLTGLTLDVTMNEAHSGLFHYWPNDKTSIIPAKDVMNSGHLACGDYPFKPYVMFGNEEAGLGLFLGESHKGFCLNDEDRCISVTGENGKARMQMHIFDRMPDAWGGEADRWVAALPPLCFTIGFQATPVKPVHVSDVDYKYFHYGDKAIRDLAAVGKLNDAEYLVNKLTEAGVRRLVLHEQWSTIQNYGLPANPDYYKKLVAACHRNNIRVMVYFGYECSTLHPAFNANAEKWLIRTGDGHFTGGWQRKPHQRAYMVCYRGGYAEELRRRVAYVMDELGVDDIYTDGTFVPWECANEAHGCGWRDSKGELQPSYPVLAVREHVKQLYELVHERGGIIDTHQSTCCMMTTLSFCDSIFDGENIQDQLHKDNLDFLDMAAFRTEYMGYNLGVPANFIAYTNEERPMGALEGLSLLHNVHCRSWSFSDLDYMQKIWRIFDDYRLNDAEWVPYWRNDVVTADAPRVTVSAYKEAGGAVTVVAMNADANCAETTLRVPAHCTRLTDLLTGAQYPVEHGAVTVPVELCLLHLLRAE